MYNIYVRIHASCLYNFLSLHIGPFAFGYISVCMRSRAFLHLHTIHIYIGLSEAAPHACSVLKALEKRGGGVLVNTRESPRVYMLSTIFQT